jgi:hypothetical protein
MQGLLLDRFFSVSDTEHPFNPGDILEGRLRLVREIAQGGMGVVFIRSEARTPHRAHVLKVGFANRLPPEVRHATESRIRTSVKCLKSIRPRQGTEALSIY